MPDLSNKNYPISDNYRFNVKTVSGIGLGIFLFLLFFQPLELANPDFNARLIILATFGAITLVLLGIFRIILPLLLSKTFSPERWNLKKEIIIDLLFVACNSVAFVFFAKYVGRVPVTFHTVIIIVILSLITVWVVIIRNQIFSMRTRIKEYSEIQQNHENKIPQKPDTFVVFHSENKTDFLRLKLQQIVLIKSANNYVEVVYKEENKTKKKLIRSTLKQTEEIFARYPEIIRCHRSYMVNKNYILKVTRNNDGLTLVLHDYPEEIIVSRNYVITVKEALGQNV